MKVNKKIVLLVALALFLSLTACTRQASTSPVTSPTQGGEAPFPYTTPGDLSGLATQTVIALTPQAGAAPTVTPQVLVATNTPNAAGESGGGQQPVEPQPAAPAAVEPAAVNTPEVVRPSTYTLQKGEWPICIARRYDLDISTLFTLNGMNMNSKPAAGTVLKIPSSGTWSANYGARSLRAHPTTHSVVSGETVYTIACRYGDVTPEAILAVNGLGSAADVQSGMSLKIP